MRKFKRILCLVLVFTFCVVPMGAFAQDLNDENNTVVEKNPYNISGTLFRQQDFSTGVNIWYVKDEKGVQHKLKAYLPGMEKAFKDYEGLRVAVSGVRARHIDAPLEVNQIAYNRHLCTVEMVLAGKLEYQYNKNQQKMQYVLVVNTVTGNEKYVIEDINKILNKSLVGKAIVISGSRYPGPNFRAGKLYK